MAPRYTKRPNGYYETKVWDGTYTKDGKKHRKALYAKTVRELDAKVYEMKRQVEAGNFIQSDGDDFLSFSAKWYREVKGSKSGNTKQMYKNIIEKHFRSAEGVKVEDFSFVHAKRILEGSEGHPRTQEQVLMTLRQIIKYAVREKRYKQNAASDLLECLPKVKHEAKEKRGLTPGEKDAVFKAELPNREKCFLYLIYGCGMRREEALALTTFSFDYKGHVTITKALALLNGGAVESKGPKTKRGARTLPLPSSIRKTVEDYAKACEGPLFPNMTKNTYDTMWRHIRKAIEKECPDSEGLTAHVFRHNYCTELCYQIPTISIKNVARLLGDTEAMVLNVYSHLDLLREPTDEVLSAAF